MKKIITVSLLAVIVVFSALIFNAPESYAGKGLPFGGRIVYMQTCTNGQLIVVASFDPRFAGTYLITPGVISRNGALPGITKPVLGTYVPGIQCYIPPAVAIPTKGAIVEYGTSIL